MTQIRADTVKMTPGAELPERWAAELGRGLVSELSAEDAQLLQDRVVSLGHGVELAHLRHGGVREPTMGAWKASDAEDESTPWLWLVVLIPAGDASRHLGWMAHLAAGLHDERCRRDLLQAREIPALLSALDAMVSDQAPHRHSQQRLELPSTTDGGPSHRLVVAILKEVEFVDHLLALFVEHDVRGATVIEARGMAEHLAAHMSLFAGFKSAFKSVGHSQVLLTVVPAERTAEVLDLVRLCAGGMSTPGSGIAFALDVPAVVGLDKAGH